ncbi:MAG: serine/threonine protein kinase [Deltaproteobacteria bacterium]|nr:serine/threonine protein kinase [Deltaproteobacteria bacterium]
MTDSSDQPSAPWQDALLADRYRLKARVGSGSMAQVFRAVDEGTGESVAVKILRPELVGEQALIDAFVSEARLGATVSHPNVIDVRHVGALPDGTHYLVTELCEGQTLEQLLEAEGALPLPLIYDLAAQICAGLSAAHTKGVIHRDLKPENILLPPREDGSHGCKLLDFGLAKLPTPQTVSKPGVFVGTPRYASPEQAMNEPLDMRTDIYSLGIVLYEMAAGRPPFDAPGFVDILKQHLHEPPDEIGPARNAAGLEPIPDLLEALIMRCLEKQPADRHVTVRRVATDLDAIRAGILDRVSAELLQESSPRMVRARLASQPSFPPPPALPEVAPVKDRSTFKLLLALALLIAGIAIGCWTFL